MKWLIVHWIQHFIGVRGGTNNWNCYLERIQDKVKQYFGVQYEAKQYLQKEADAELQKFYRRVLPPPIIYEQVEEEIDAPEEETNAEEEENEEQEEEEQEEQNEEEEQAENEEESENAE